MQLLLKSLLRLLSLSMTLKGGYQHKWWLGLGRSKVDFGRWTWIQRWKRLVWGFFELTGYVIISEITSFFLYNSSWIMNPGQPHSWGWVHVQMADNCRGHLRDYPLIRSTCGKPLSAALWLIMNNYLFAGQLPFFPFPSLHSTSSRSNILPLFWTPFWPRCPLLWSFPHSFEMESRRNFPLPLRYSGKR